MTVAPRAVTADAAYDTVAVYETARTRGPLTAVSRSRAVGRILTLLLGQRVDKDHAGLIDAKVELPPATSAAATVFRGGPLACPDDGQARAVEHEMDALAGRACWLLAPSTRTIRASASGLSVSAD